MSDLLFLAHRLPFPPDRGDKIRSYHVLRHLAVRTRVHLVAFADKAMATAVAATLAAHPIACIYAFSGQMAQYLPAGAPSAVMDFVDVDSAKFAGYAAQAHGSIRWLMKREARLLGAYERAVSQAVAASLFVSEAEAALFRAGGDTGCVAVVENGIDTAHFDPDRDYPRIEGEGPLAVFTGQMDYPPNTEAVTGFARDVLPRIRARHRATRFAIVGRAPTAAVRALAGDGVIVTGTVPDTRPWLAAADVCVAPLAVARGVQNKVFEAMAMARPVVASAAAAEGIDHAGTIRVAGDAATFADAVSAVLDDPWAAATQGQAARVQAIARYGWDARLAPLGVLLGLA